MNKKQPKADDIFYYIYNKGNEKHILVYDMNGIDPIFTELADYCKKATLVLT